MTWNDSLYWRDRDMPEPSLEPPYEPEEDEEQEGEDEMNARQVGKLVELLTPEEREICLMSLVVTCKDCIWYENYCKGYGKEGYCSEAVRKTPAEPETPEKGRKVC